MRRPEKKKWRGRSFWVDVVEEALGQHLVVNDSARCSLFSCILELHVLLKRRSPSASGTLPSNICLLEHRARHAFHGGLIDGQANFPSRPSKFHFSRHLWHVCLRPAWSFTFKVFLHHLICPVFWNFESTVCAYRRLKSLRLANILDHLPGFT